MAKVGRNASLGAIKSYPKRAVSDVKTGKGGEYVDALLYPSNSEEHPLSQISGSSLMSISNIWIKRKQASIGSSHRRRIEREVNHTSQDCCDLLGEFRVAVRSDSRISVLTRTRPLTYIGLIFRDFSDRSGSKAKRSSFDQDALAKASRYMLRMRYKPDKSNPLLIRQKQLAVFSNANYQVKDNAKAKERYTCGKGVVVDPEKRPIEIPRLIIICERKNDNSLQMRAWIRRVVIHQTLRGRRKDKVVAAD
ncbi:hypothetical protein F5876DRAFT_61189 [Lentinula aff. lateritia]|uniref:Uncharacterized protein n=1 Tax=Lentinula aff. lateritia TaxID=2804960 RepID=A0ACC1UGD5_9AGAR|nr:hypothetical protein F5876DRAFT_61189 [Lentinula aff. lateritia]